MAKKKKQQHKHEPVAPLAKSTTFFNDKKLHLFLVFILSFVLYSNTLFNGYTLDDSIVILDNDFTKQGFAGIPDILSKDSFHGFFKTQKNLVAGGRYRPLSIITFAMEYQFFGKNAFVSHLGNIVLFGMLGCMLYLLVLQFFNPSGKRNNDKAYLVALITTLIFVAHPVHTEAVANIKGRDELMTVLGSLAATYFAIRGYLKKDMSLAILGGFILFLALMAKENALTFLVIIPMSFYFFTKAKVGDIIKYSAPALVAILVFMAIRTSVIGLEGTTTTAMELMNNPFLKYEGGVYVPFSFMEKMATVMFTLGKYLVLLVFPHPLTHDYYPREIDIMTFGDWQSILSLLAYIAIGVYALIRLPKKDPIAYGIWFYLFTLSIVSNVFVSVGTNMNERFIFLPSIGFCLIAAVLLYRLAQKRGDGSITDRMKPIFLGLGVVLFLFSVKTFTRNLVWKDNLTLFTTDVKTSSNSAKLLNAAAGEIMSNINKPIFAGNRDAKLQEAAGYAKRALEIHPTYENAYLQLANANTYMEKFDEAIKYYGVILKSDPQDRDAMNNIGYAYRLNKNFDKAIEYHKKAFELYGKNYPKTKEELVKSYREAGEHFGKQNQLAKAIPYLIGAYELDKSDIYTIRSLGTAYGLSGNSEKAVEFFSKSVKIDPSHAPSWLNLAIANRGLGNEAKYNEYLQKAKQLDPTIQ